MSGVRTARLVAGRGGVVSLADEVMSMRSSARAVSVAVLLALGCGKDPADTGMTAPVSEEGGETSTSSGGMSVTGDPASTSGAPTTGGTGGPPGTETGAASSDGGCNFICDLPGMETKECSNWAQDCPDGQKCMPFADNGGTAWNATKCVDVEEDADSPGDPCTVEGGAVSGLDSCEFGAMCWDVNPQTNEGICVSLCTGTPDAPVCDLDFTCFVSNDGILNLCLLLCDPLAPECIGDDLCIPNPQGQGEFTCVLDASGDEGQPFDACEFINSCDPGNFCALPANAMECDPESTGCCLPFCPLDQPPECPGVGQECLPWFEDGTAPPGFEQVGFCGIPMG
jgi:hypothetical protein